MKMQKSDILLKEKPKINMLKIKNIIMLEVIVIIDQAMIVVSS